LLIDDEQMKTPELRRRVAQELLKPNCDVSKLVVSCRDQENIGMIVSSLKKNLSVEYLELREWPHTEIDTLMNDVIECNTIVRHLVLKGGWTISSDNDTFFSKVVEAATKNPSIHIITWYGSKHKCISMLPQAIRNKTDPSFGCFGCFGWLCVFRVPAVCDALNRSPSNDNSYLYDNFSFSQQNGGKILLRAVNNTLTVDVHPSTATEVMAELSKTIPVVRISICGLKLKEEDSQALGRVIKTTPIQRLYLACCNRRHDNSLLSTATIANAIKESSTLEELSLHGTPWGPQNSRVLGEAIAANKSLKKLDLQRLLLSDKGAKAIAKALKVNERITYLALMDTGIGNAGARAIASMLKVNCYLKRLDVRANRIGLHGCTALWESVGFNLGLALQGILCVPQHRTCQEMRMIQVYIDSCVDTNKIRQIMQG